MPENADLSWEGRTEAKEAEMSEKETIEQPEDDVSPEDVLGADAFDTPADPETEEGPEEQEAEAQPTEEVEGAETGQEGAGETEGTEEAQPEADAEPEQPAVPELVPYVFDYGGVRQELMVTPEVAEKMEAQKTTALQFPHLQQKREEERRQWEMAQAAAQQAQMAAQQQSSQPTTFDPEAFTQAMQGQVADAVKNGVVSEDFAELYPVETASLIWAGGQLREIAGMLVPLASQVTTSSRQSQVEEFKAQVFGEMQRLASESPEVFGDLQSQETRESYLDFMTEYDLPIQHFLDGRAKDTLSRMWGAFRSDELRAAALAAAQARRSESETQRRNAGGAGGGGGSRSKPKPTHEDISEILGV